MAEPTHPAVTIASHLLGPGWSLADLIVREGEAALVEMRRGRLWETQIVVAREGEWVEPGVISQQPDEVPTRRPSETSFEQPVLQPRQRASGWPGDDGELPTQVWLSLDGLVAKDVVGVIVSTDADRYEASVRHDGTFLALARARRGEEPRLQLRLRTGEQLQASL
jgi:hypothetical protein